MAFGGNLPEKKPKTYSQILDEVWSLSIKDQEELLRLLEKKKKDGRFKSKRS